MVAAQQLISPLEQVCVSLDLETTGLKPDSDAILEVGAVRFRGDEVLDTFQTFVNPGREIPDFVQRYTGITPQDIRRAPPFPQIRDDLAAFIGRAPVVAHSVGFDLGFLESHGLSLPNPAYDTLDLATVFLPFQRRYSLAWLIAQLGIAPERNRRDQRSHRATYDALAHKELFVKLLRVAAEQDAGLLAYVTDLARRSDWKLHPALAGLAGAGERQRAAVGPSGLNHEQLARRLDVRGQQADNAPGSDNGRPGADGGRPEIGESDISGMLGPGGPFARTFGGFEHRPEQEQMLDAVAAAVYNKRRLIIEGGTGVGKSLAYLLPAALFAVSRGQRVVVSTNTINLQEQLTGKDLPALQQALEETGILEPGQLKVALLKGRANYLCLRRWSQLSRSEALSVDDAKLLAKTSVWLQDTESGDRGEINLMGRDAVTWHHISAGEKGFCLDLRDGSPCFLRAARQRAEQAHIIVVNHALLMTDLAFGGGLIPEYRNVIIDEAHHLEDAATSQFGFELAQGELEQAWSPVGRLAAEVRPAAAGNDNGGAGVSANADLTMSALEAEGPRLREAWERLFAALQMLRDSRRRGRRRDQPDQNQLLITTEVRRSPAWAELHLAWENLDARLTLARNAAVNLHNFLNATRLPNATDQAALTVESAALADGLEALSAKLGSILGGEPDDNAIHWLEVNPQQSDAISLHSAPLDVSGILAEKLFDEKDCVILTSATLSADGDFEYLKRRVGFATDGDKAQVDELLVGSPFDYRRAAQALIPEDMPPPNANGYVGAVSEVLGQLGQSLEGRTLALFTAHSSLRAVAQRLRPILEPQGIPVLAQGVDGSAQYVMSAFAETPNSVLLGTASFWEGIDLPPGLLKALVIARLPFQVPSDPIVQSRSALYGDPFGEYSIPNAVLRFRQGLGRLIRNKNDRGTIVVLDSRIISHGYGRAFQNSMPPCRHTPCLTANVGMLAAQWLEGGRRGRGAR